MNKESVSNACKRVYIGIDVHRAFFVASCVSAGVVIKRCRMSAQAEAVIKFITKYFPDCEVKTCYETGYSGFWLHRKLIAAGIDNIVVHAAAIEVAANDRVKTDKRDSLKMAIQLEAGRLKGVRVPGIDEEYRRLVPRTREQIARAIRRIQNQIRMRLHQFGLFPEGYNRPLRIKDAQNFIQGLDGDLVFSLESLLCHWQYLVEIKKLLEQRMKQQASIDPLETLYRSVPGIGPLSARVLSSELGDMSQFANVRGLYCFTGLTPGEYSSGKKVYKGHISRQGSSRLRYLLVEAAWKAVRKDPGMKRFYEELAKRTGKKRAIVATARKLIGKVRAVIRNARPYENEYTKLCGTECSLV